MGGLLGKEVVTYPHNQQIVTHYLVEFWIIEFLLIVYRVSKHFIVNTTPNWPIGPIPIKYSNTSSTLVPYNSRPSDCPRPPRWKVLQSEWTDNRFRGQRTTDNHPPESTSGTPEKVFRRTHRSVVQSTERVQVIQDFLYMWTYWWWCWSYVL